MTLILISVAGGMGAACRYVLSLWLVHYQGTLTIPIPILIINLSGSLLLGLCHSMYDASPTGMEYLLTTWFLGAFTTFSTFSLESIKLIEDKKWKTLFWYVSITVVGSIGTYGLGYYVLSVIA
ncbi:fluoride efflux transporter FluC [Alkalicoccobacillus porphyridii]|uniref:Fluoride-specific ion channel FluC n=1 Tax=Alkalicoccobacillus porphyridii TaxID=2597270 RepID=A0A553ZTY8_9BACI|nr:CrcB family protein [Alkalicoccobacillus porphyridii]TSB44941.1 fluoride efflux transporter CrcB [Alkalicoccobacillus porphyridii]